MEPLKKKDAGEVKPIALVIPFEPKLYMSEIDQNVSKESKLNAKQIRYAFRSGLDYMVVAEFKKMYSVVSLMSDTSHSLLDQRYIYESIGYKYEVVPAENGTIQKDNLAESDKVKNGQLTVVTNDQRKFMNTKITNPNLLPVLHKKYGADVFIFINELDIKLSADNSGRTNGNGSYERTVAVHYSIYDVNGNLLNAGLVAKNFPSATNDVKKIVNGYFNEVAGTMYHNYVTATTSKKTNDKGALKWSSPEEGKK